MTNQRGEPLRICRKCRIHHVENCRSCLGFGFSYGGRVLTAAEAHDKDWRHEPEGWRACQECGGSPVGGYVRVSGCGTCDGDGVLWRNSDHDPFVTVKDVRCPECNGG